MYNIVPELFTKAEIAGIVVGVICGVTALIGLTVVVVYLSRKTPQQEGISLYMLFIHYMQDEFIVTTKNLRTNSYMKCISLNCLRISRSLYKSPVFVTQS